MSSIGRQLPRALALGVLLTALPSAAGAQVTSYAFVPNSGPNTVSVVETRTRTVVGPAIPTGFSDPQGVVILPDGRKAYVSHVGVGGTSIVPIDVATRTAGTPIPIASTSLSLTALPDGSRLYVGGFSTATVKVIDTATDTVVTSIPVGNNPASLAATPDGSRVYVTNNGSSSVSVIDTATNTVLTTIPTGVGPGGVIVTRDGQRVYAGNFGANTVSVIDTATNTVVATLPTGSNPTGADVSPDGAEVAMVNFISNTVTLIATANNAITTIPAGNGPHGVAYTPDGREIYTTNYNANAVSVIDRTSGTIVATIPVGAVPYSLTPFLTAPILTTSGGGGAQTSAGEAALDALGVRRYVIFDTGVLQLTAPWTTTRNLSLLAGGGTIDTQAFNASVSGTVTNPGALTKTGSGTLTLAGAATHTGGSIVQQGTLLVDGTHASAIGVQGGTLGGNGTVDAINATNGVVAPGTAGPGILTAASATLAAGTTFTVQLNGAAPGTGYDRLATGTATIANATLSVSLGYTPASGAIHTILTNATGTFAGLAEGATIAAGGAVFHITYLAGSGSDVALVADLPPTITPPADRTFFTNALPTLAFTVNDDLTAAASLVVTASSSNTTLLPNALIMLGNTGGTGRTISPIFAPGMTGSTTITLNVSDGFQSAQATFTLTVTPPTYYLGEGATGPFFSTDLLLANPQSVPVPVTITYYKDDGTSIVQTLTLPAASHRTVHVDEVPGMEAANFSTTVVSTSSFGHPVVVERTMWWDGSGYGAHTEKASPAIATDWYFAEGSQGFFSTYFLLQNPAATANVAHVTYYLDGGAPVSRDYTLAPRSRLTIDAGLDTALANRSFGARVQFDQPGMAERAMYFGSAPLFSGGHAAAGVGAPSTAWLLAEGATGSFFDTFVLIANPGGSAATITARYLPSSGAPIVKTHTIPAGQRLTINIATEDAALASAAVSVQIDSTQPVVVERAQYWPHGDWYEAHASAAETAPALRWGLAEGRVGGADQAQTYILIANPGTQAASVGVTFLRESGVPVVKTFTVAAQSRFNVAVTGPGSSVPELADESFGAFIASTQPVLVERSMYTNAGGVVWAAGTNATATPMP